MNELQVFIAAIQSAISGCVAACNSALGKLPPVEQFQANQQLQYGLRDMQMSGACMIDYMNRLSEALNGKTPGALSKAESAENPVLAASMPSMVALAEAVQKLPEKMRSVILAEITKDGAFIAKTDHEAAIGVAENAARNAAEVEITAKFERAAKLHAQRIALFDGIPAAIAAKFPEDELIGEKASEAVATFKARFKSLTDIGLTAEKNETFLAEIAGFGGGKDADYEHKTAPLFSVAGTKPAAPKTAPINPAALAGVPATEGSPKRLRV